MIALLQAGDVITTCIALKKGAIEGNLLMSRIMDILGVVPALIVAKVILIAILALVIDILSPHSIITAALFVITAIYIIVLANNIRRL
ncbi:MAG TPA: DUF5658 family protein [Methanothrix sp.]|nr:DUF5658 family protein [Methanothrix sp.]HOL44629.1 DUF5658 family protein [Methanothrix sp.]